MREGAEQGLLLWRPKGKRNRAAGKNLVFGLLEQER